MTQARSHLIPRGTGGMFHCVQRCVRRAFLCGLDQDTGRCFEHRKRWVEDRIQRLAECFAVGIHAYAVMSNHLHVVLQLEPDQTLHWSDSEVASRWVRLFPPREDSDEARALKCLRLISNPERLDEVRHRLGSLSWFMRCLAEPIARRANREDGCTGRFWEGRFKAQMLWDERALLAAMTYVDPNPIRAGMTETLRGSRHTTVHRRIKQATHDRSLLHQRIKPLAGCIDGGISITTADYLGLLEWTGRQLAPGKKGKIAAATPSVLQNLEHEPERWAVRVRAVGSGYWRVVGEACDLIDIAQRLGQAWMKGIGLAVRLAREH
jgi:REP element-mobilizing transposase RayT